MDLINGLFELAGGLLLCLNCWRLYRDGEVRGVSLLPTGLFTLWAYWNLIFYSATGFTFSLWAGVLVVCVNTFWLGQALWLLYRPRKKQKPWYEGAVFCHHVMGVAGEDIPIAAFVAFNEDGLIVQARRE